MKTFFNKHIKHIALVVLSLGLVFGVASSASAAWSYNGADILYTVTGPNNAPVVDAGADKPLTLPTSSVSVTGTASDSDGSIVYTNWQFVSGPATASVGTQNNTTPSTVTLSGMNVTGTYVFRFNAQDNVGAWGQDDMEVTVTNAGVPSGYIDVPSCTIAAGASTCAVAVTWTTSNLTANPTEVTKDRPAPNTHFSWATSGTSVADTIAYGSTSYYLYHNSVFLDISTATASCISGTSWNGSTCQTTPPGAASVTLNASPSTVFTGNTSTLSWTSANVSSCTASATPVSGSWTGARATASSFPHESTGPLSVTTTFTLSCTGSSGPASSSKTVTVVPPTGSNIIAELTATPDRIASGDSSILSWTSANATSCSGIGFSTGGATSGSTSVSPTVNTTYTLTCTNSTDSASDQASVTLKRKFLFIEF